MKLGADPAIRMTFGKHKGERIEDLDSDYLRWIDENIKPQGWDRTKQAIVDAARAEMESREKFGE